MSNFQLNKGQYTVIGIKLFKYDLDGGGLPVEDTTTPVTIQQAASQLLVEPVNSGPGNRDFYVSVAPSQTTSTVNDHVVLGASIPADGNGAGAPLKNVSADFAFDAVVPIDHRGSQATGPAPAATLPHPPTA